VQVTCSLLGCKKLYSTKFTCLCFTKHGGNTIIIRVTTKKDGALHVNYFLKNYNTDQTKMTRWPSGLRRQIKALVRKGVGSNPTLVRKLFPPFQFIL
jgi:hypothetical protein